MFSTRQFHNYFVLTIIISLTLLSCKQPNEMEPLYLPNSSPENVILNLETAYSEKNLTQYLNCLSDSFSFLSSRVGVWGKQEEIFIHEALFSQGFSLRVNMIRLSGDASSGSYAYDISIRRANIVEQADGFISFYFVQSNNKRWFIKVWHEKETAPVLKVRQNHINYFPLQVGNYWIYEEQNLKRASDIKASVVDSISVGEKTYYKVEGFEFSISYGYDFVRTDSTGKIFGLIQSDSSEVVLYDFTLAIGDTWSFPVQSSSERVIVQFEGCSQEPITTPARIFEKVCGFSSRVSGSGSVIIEEFAPNVGLIAIRVENESWLLKEARISGKIIPDSTIVGIRKKTWGEIKARYLRTDIN